MPAAESHLLPVYAPPEQVFVRGEGCWIWDDKGERYLDCIAGIAVDALGHAPPVLVKALTEQAGKLWHVSNLYEIPGQRRLAAVVAHRNWNTAWHAQRVWPTRGGTVNTSTCP